MKYRVLNAIRKFGLLGMTDSLRYHLRVQKNRSANHRFEREFPDFKVPPKHLAYDAYNNVHWYLYKDYGLIQAQELVRIIREDTLPEELNIFEWGCGPARLIRHMASLFPAPHRVSLTGSDYNPETIAWCREAFPEIRFVLNDLDPPVELPDDQFDIIYNFSVFTHLSEAVCLTWIEELTRILKPGGLMVCTTHGDNYRHLLTSREDLQKYEAGEMIAQAKYAEGKKWFLTLHPEKFVREKLLAGFEQVRKAEANPDSLIFQDVWVARKPLHPAGSD